MNQWTASKSYTTAAMVIKKWMNGHKLGVINGTDTAISKALFLLKVIYAVKLREVERILCVIKLVKNLARRVSVCHISQP